MPASGPWTLTDRRKIDAVLALPYAIERRDAWRRLNVEIGSNNQAAIDECDAVLAILDGTDVDSGTAAEIGYAFAKRKPIVGYRGDFRLSADNEGSIVNLQVEYFIGKAAARSSRHSRISRERSTGFDRPAFHLRLCHRADGVKRPHRRNGRPE